MIHLYLEYFQAKTKERQDEYEYSIQQNINCTQIDRIFIIASYDTYVPFTHEKITVLRNNNRTTYKMWVEYSLIHTKGVSVYCNADMYFNESVVNIHKYLDNEKDVFIALSRYELEENGNLSLHINPQWSQDVWAFNTNSTFTSTLIKGLDIIFGVPRCDNKSAYVFAINGWKVINPCKDIFTIHVHNTQFRTYSKKRDTIVLGGIAYVYPYDETTGESILEADVWGKNIHRIKKVVLNKSLDKWAAADANEIVEAVPNTIVYKDTVFTIKHDTYNNKLIYFYNDVKINESDVLIAVPNKPLQKLPQILLCVIVTPCLNLPFYINEMPIHDNDYLHWQYPCYTERQAYINHAQLAIASNLDTLHKEIHTYIAMPWATMIDKRIFPYNEVNVLSQYIKDYIKLCQKHGYKLRVHTVCQQIHWDRFLEYFYFIGITDLHLPHLEKRIDIKRIGYAIRLHNWSLYAVNIEEASRQEGLNYNITNKKYLASFKGGYMAHYKSPLRLQLPVVKNLIKNNDDIYINIDNVWHYEHVVYHEQVGSKKPIKTPDAKSYYIYNQLLSDSVFSLCPEGAGINTIRLWESLAMGSIPVILITENIDLMLLNVHPELKNCTIVCHEKDLQYLFRKLKSFTPEKIDAMSTLCKQVYNKVRNLNAFDNCKAQAFYL